MPAPEGGNPTRVTGRRIVGSLIEGFIDALALLACYSIAGIKVKQGQLGTLTPEVVNNKIPLVLTLYLVYVVATKVISLAFLGWTPGMLMTSIRCVRYDGRPPGIGRALVRTIIWQLGAQFGALWDILTYFVVTTNASRKGIHDMVAGTYVVDSIYLGHLLLRDSDGGVMVGPKSITRAEAERELRKQGAAAAPHLQDAVQQNYKNGEPFLDKNLDTYVVWNEKHHAWLAFDKRTGGWVQIG